MKQRLKHNASKTQVTERIFKLIHIHALVIYQIRWIHRISLSFRENSISLYSTIVLEGTENKFFIWKVKFRNVHEIK